MTNSVVASCVVFVPATAVGAAGTPVNVGLEMLAFGFTAVMTKAVVASCVVFVPATAVGAAGTPVNVGLEMLAFGFTAVMTKAVVATSVELFPAVCVVAVVVAGIASSPCVWSARARTPDVPTVLVVAVISGGATDPIGATCLTEPVVDVTISSTTPGVALAT